MAARKGIITVLQVLQLQGISPKAASCQSVSQFSDTSQTVNRKVLIARSRSTSSKRWFIAISGGFGLQYSALSRSIFCWFIVHLSDGYFIGFQHMGMVITPRANELATIRATFPAFALIPAIFTLFHHRSFLGPAHHRAIVSMPPKMGSRF